MVTPGGNPESNGADPMTGDEIDECGAGMNELGLE